MKYFGTDGIRGIPGDSLPYHLCKKLGNSLSKLNVKNLIMAEDTRESSALIRSHLIEGITMAGINVTFLGIISTPELIYYSKLYNSFAIMITASHNPYTDNGIKIVSSGFKLTQIEEEILENFIDNEPYSISDTKGIVCKIEDSNKKYLEFISKYISKYDLNIAIDAANGAASYISKLVFDKVSDKTSYIASNPNGRNVNLNCGSTNIEFLKNYVLENNCDLGFSFDGDGDRIIAVSKNGNIIDGDLIIYILAIYLKEKNMLNKNTVVTTIMSNLGVKKALNLKNISTIEVNVGDKYVYDALNKNGLSLGGEASGHIIVKDIFETGDGILISLLLLKAINELGLTLDDFYNQIELSYSRLINIKVNDKERVMNNISLFNRRSEIEKLLGDSSKVIIRPSGTENLIRLSIITFDFKNADKYILELKNIIENI